VTFTWDLPRAEELVRQWETVAPVRIGGPATGEPGGAFIPGRYLAYGHVITSRGCFNKCWFCSVWKREGPVRELPISDGWIIHDDNLLACSIEHRDRVFAMLERQPHRPRFVGGLEPALVTKTIAERIVSLRPDAVFLAYDTPDDLDPMLQAASLFLTAGLTTSGHRLRCYVLIGYPGDTISQAEHRLFQTLAAGCIPQAMLYRPPGRRLPLPLDKSWRRLARLWARPAYIARQALTPPDDSRQIRLLAQ